MAQNNGGKCDRNFVAAVLAIVVGAVVTIATPELRKLFCLEKDKPVPVTTTTSGPFSATLHENQPQFIEAAKTSLSIVFNEEYKIVTLTIAPDGTRSSNRAVLNGYTEEFTSSAGDFLLHVLNIEWSSRIITIHVSRKI